MTLASPTTSAVRDIQTRCLTLFLIAFSFSFFPISSPLQNFTSLQFLLTNPAAPRIWVAAGREIPQSADTAIFGYLELQQKTLGRKWELHECFSLNQSFICIWTPCEEGKQSYSNSSKGKKKTELQQKYSNSGAVCSWKTQRFAYMEFACYWKIEPRYPKPFASTNFHFVFLSWHCVEGNFLIRDQILNMEWNYESANIPGVLFFYKFGPMWNVDQEIYACTISYDFLICYLFIFNNFEFVFSAQFLTSYWFILFF